jgi:ParB family chromosome partitioning protein
VAKRKLGRGIEDMLKRKPAEEPGATELDVGVIFPNRFQPREGFDEESLERLADSIKHSGVLQPVVVRRAEGGYELVLGERRWRAARRAGLTKIPALVRDVKDGELLEYALIENVQREDLNPIERAKAFKQLVEKFGLRQEDISERLGIERSVVSNTVRLLELPEEVQGEIARGRVAMGHAKALLVLGSAREQRELCREIVEKGLSVRDLEKAVVASQARPKKGIGRRKTKSPELTELEMRMMGQVGSNVTIKEKEGKGYIRIEFEDMQQCQRIVNVLLGLTR